MLSRPGVQLGPPVRGRGRGRCEHGLPPNFTLFPSFADNKAAKAERGVGGGYINMQRCVTLSQVNGQT